MFNITSLKKDIKAFVDLPAGKQVIYLMITLIVVCAIIIYNSNRKIENINLEKVKELNDCNKNVKELEMKLDEAYIEKYNLKVEYLNKELSRADSLLNNSKNIQSSINPLIKKINKKLDEVNN